MDELLKLQNQALEKIKSNAVKNEDEPMIKNTQDDRNEKGGNQSQPRDMGNMNVNRPGPASSASIVDKNIKIIEDLSS